MIGKYNSVGCGIFKYSLVQEGEEENSFCLRVGCDVMEDLCLLSNMTDIIPFYLSLTFGN